MTSLEFAQYYLQQGFAVFPVYEITPEEICSCSAGASCNSPAKHPRTINGLKDASKDPLHINEWWTKYPNANIAIATGQISNLYALDVDQKSGGFASLEKLVQEYGDLFLKTMCWHTGGGGMHYLFRSSLPLKNRCGFSPGLDFKGENGYIIAPPSNHKSGGSYHFSDSVIHIIAEIPNWLLEIITKNNPKTDSITFDVENITEGKRNTTLFDLACDFRRKGHKSNNIAIKINRINNERCNPPLEQDEIAQIITNACNTIKDIPKLKPQDLADLILEENNIITDTANNSYIYNNIYWKPLSDSELETMAMTIDNHKETTKKRCQDTAFYVHRKSHTDAIKWQNIRKDEIAFENGVLDLTNWGMRPHKAEDYLENCIPHSLTGNTTSPIWLDCLQQWFNGDNDKVLLLQEFMGYILMTRADYKKALICIGQSNTGKSVLGHVLTHMVGRSNTCEIDMERMGNPRELQPLIGKKLNLIPELSVKGNINEGGFKKLVSTEEGFTINPKYKDPILYTPHCKHVLLTNNLPSINDCSDGTINRLLILNFDCIVPTDSQNPELPQKLKLEINGIILWALQGALRLIKNNGKFTSNGSIKNSLEDYQRCQNPLLDFIQEYCVKTTGDIPMGEFRTRLRSAYPEFTKISDKAITTKLKTMGINVINKGRYRGILDYRWADNAEFCN